MGNQAPVSSGGSPCEMPKFEVLTLWLWGWSREMLKLEMPFLAMPP